MKLYAPNIARIILDSLSTQNSVNIFDAIDAAISIQYPLEPASLRADLAASIVEKVRTQLNKHLDSCAEKRIQSYFRWSEYDKDLIISLHNPRLVHGNEPEEAKYRYTNELQEYLKQTDPNTFEKLGQQLLRFINCDAFTTRSSKDGGIDFGGFLMVFPVGDETDYEINARLLQKFSIRIVGQAKRYNNSIEVKEVRELQGITHEAIIDRIVELNKTQPNALLLSKKSFPIVLMFITTSNFTRGAKEFASDVGMILMDGEQIAQSLLKMGYGCIRNESGHWEFDKPGLELWLKSL